MKNDELKDIKLPEGKCCGKCCGDCMYMDTYDKNKYDECYCGKKKKYYPPADSACGEFDWK